MYVFPEKEYSYGSLDTVNWLAEIGVTENRSD